MPTYNFRHRETGEIIEKHFKNADREDFFQFLDYDIMIKNEDF
jgi:hypothetical protein